MVQKVSQQLKDLVVQKYGGSSLANLKKITAAARNIQLALKDYKKILVVVSAMGEFTDILLDKAKKLSKNPPKRELDMLLTTGERISTSLLCIALDNLGIRAASLTGSQSGILTDGQHGNARITKILGTRIIEGFEQNDVMIVAGFQGVYPKTKDITSLGRGGSDLSALALAQTFRAEVCQIFTDVEGIMTADPRLVPKARSIEKLSWQAMNQLAWAGALVIHHRGATLAKKYRLAVEMRCSLPNKKKYSQIHGDQSMEGPLLTALAHKKNLVFVEAKTKQNPLKDQVIKEALIHLGAADASPDIFHFARHKDDWHLKLLLPKRALSILADSLHEQVEQLTDQMPLGMVSLIGEGFRQNPEFVGEIISCINVTIEYCETNDSTIYFVVAESDVEVLLRELHARYFES